MNGASSSQTALDILSNIGALFGPLQHLIDHVTFTVGMFVALGGAFALVYSRRGESTSWGSAAAGLVIGALMMSVQYFMSSATVSTFGHGAPTTALSYSTGNSSEGNAATLIVHFILDFASLFGWYWAFKGFYLLRRSYHPRKAQQDDASKGLVRLVAAWAACNMLVLTTAFAHLAGFHNPLSLT